MSTSKLSKSKYYRLPDDPKFDESIYHMKQHYLFRQRKLNERETNELLNKLSSQQLGQQVELRPHQILLGNYFGPETPHKKGLIFHDPGTGKTISALVITESFRPVIDGFIRRGYNDSKIYIISADEARNNFVDSLLLKYSGQSYLSETERNTYVSLMNQSHLKPELEERIADMRREFVRRLKRDGHIEFMGPRKFQNRTIGPRRNKNITPNDDDPSILHVESGEYVRLNSETQPIRLDNCIVVVDEAHDWTDNDWGVALRHTIDSAKNVRLFLLTATPMKNKAKEIIELLNFVLPKKKRLTKHQVFDKTTGQPTTAGLHKMQMASKGYVSFLRGSNPYTFPTTIDVGRLPRPIELLGLSKGKSKIKSSKELQPFKWTKLVRCELSGIQLETYDEIIGDRLTIPREHSASLLMLMVLPNYRHALDSPKTRGSDKNSKYGLAAGIFRPDDLLMMKRNAKERWLKKKGIKFVSDKYTTVTKRGETINHTDVQVSGSILKHKNIKPYSAMYWQLLNDLSNAVGPHAGGCFIFNELVEMFGVKMIRHVLLMNGYIEYDESAGSNTDHTSHGHVRCYKCGLTYNNHQRLKADKRSIKVKLNKDGSAFGGGTVRVDAHEYKPARFVMLFGKLVSRQRRRLIETYNSEANTGGSLVKIVIGSGITRQSVDFIGLRHLFILGSLDDLPTLEQVKGRGIRHGSHRRLPERERNVRVYRYVTSLPPERSGKYKGKYFISAEEYHYLRQEREHEKIKKIERALKVGAFDCALNKMGNVFPDEILAQKRHGNNAINNVLCDYDDCDYECIYEPSNKVLRSTVSTYNRLQLNELDRSIYSMSFYGPEISRIKKLIEHVYSSRHGRGVLAHNIDSLEANIRLLAYDHERQYLERRYIYMALDELVTAGADYQFAGPFGQAGYLIYIGKYYIFQPIDNVDTTISERDRYIPRTNTIITMVPLKDYAQSQAERREVQNFNIKKLRNQLRRRDRPEQVSRLLGKLPVSVQVSVLENVIKMMLRKSTIPRSDRDLVNKVLLNYQSYLIRKQDLVSSTRRDYTMTSTISTTTSDMANVNWKLNYKQFKNKNVIVGHLLDTNPKCYSISTDSWQQCKVFANETKTTLDKLRNANENDVIIGFVDKSKSGRLMFKMRLPSNSNKIIQDKRKISRGFSCVQNNDKKQIVEIARSLGLKTRSGSGNKLPVESVCYSIEMELRRRQTLSNKKNSSVRWFYDYVDMLKLQEKEN